MPVLNCPHCVRAVNVPEQFAESTISCPLCGGGFQVPTFRSATFVGIDDEPIVRVRKRKKQGVGWGVVLIVLLVPVSLASYFLLANKNSAMMASALFDADDSDRDYFDILELDYQIVAALQVSIYWGDIRDSSAWFKDLDAVDCMKLVSRAAKGSEEALEQIKVVRRQIFAQRYGADIHGPEGGKWQRAFRKRFPESPVVFDEIKHRVHELCRNQVKSMEAELRKAFHDLDEKEYREFRRQYVFDHVFKWVEQAKKHALATPSIERMRKALSKSAN